MPYAASRAGTVRSEGSSSSSSSSTRSRSSSHSQSTTPTTHSDALSQKEYDDVNFEVYYCEQEPELEDEREDLYTQGRGSSESFISASSFPEEFSDEPKYQTWEPRYETYQSEAVPSTPSEFAKLYPSGQRFLIRHDDSTIDGNMNLRIDTEVTCNDRKQPVTLFHLRMHDLKRREFSLRRYCRDSGREVCHSARKYIKPASRRPSFQRSMSSALWGLRGGKADAKPSANTSLHRQDSGYYTGEEEDDEDAVRFSNGPCSPPGSLPTDTVLLEFSNYAHIEVKQRSVRSSKQYQFHYWGSSYTWKRIVRKDGNDEEVSYHLLNTTTRSTVAYIVPISMTPAEAIDEESKGGWVRPCSMWLSNPMALSEQRDIADVIMATGLIALVDDTIQRRWHSKHKMHFVVPDAVVRGDSEAKAKGIFHNLFNRRGKTDTRTSQLTTRTC